jgi:tetratricopeptide (TPR) repeat protein
MALPLAEKVSTRTEPVKRVAREAVDPVKRVARGAVGVAAPHFVEAGRSWAAWASARTQGHERSRPARRPDTPGRSRRPELAGRLRKRATPTISLEHYQEELRAAAGSDPKREVVRLSNLASAYRRRDELPQAQVCAKRAVEAARELGDERLLSLTLNGLGLVQARHPVPGPALVSFEEAREVAARIGDRQIEGKILTNFGTVHVRLGDRQASRAAWAEALAALDPDSSAHEELSAWLDAHPDADPAEEETAESAPTPPPAE